MKVAISFSSFSNAEKYLQNEIACWDIEIVKKAGMAVWEKKLGAIKIESPSDIQKKIFYTAMYHTMVQPRDRTGDNPKWKNNQPYWDDNFAIWDTWRSAFPLFILIDPKMVRDNISCFIDRLKHNGKVRDGFVAGVDMEDEQGGNDVDNVITEAIIKGVEGIDEKQAYQLLKNNADNERKGLISYNSHNPVFASNNAKYKEQGWIPECINSTSNTLEYAYNDYCVAQIAKKLGHTADYKKYIKRSNGWTNLWNPNLESDGYKGFIDGRKADGSFMGQDAKLWGKSWQNIFGEGTSWTYSYFVPHDINQLMKLMGGKKIFAARLEYAMENKLIDYGNEPSFLALRMFNHAGRPDLTSKWVHWIMQHNYDTTGVTGNDDTGAMSSWYVFSALGFFPNAGQDDYYINAPLYKKSVITLGNGKKLTINAKNFSDKNTYIKSCRINGKGWNSSIFRHKDIAQGGTIEIELAAQPTEWGK
jgi:predicted alpha-1,2-mannosidase